MSSIERTAYPRLPRVITLKDLQQSFTPTADEVEWVNGTSRGAALRIGLATLLKCFQHLHHFPPLAEIPPEIVEHVSASLGLSPTQALDYGGELTLTLTLTLTLNPNPYPNPNHNHNPNANLTITLTRILFIKP